MNGKVLNNQINVSGIKSGIYNLYITNNNNTNVTLKILKL